MTSLKLRQFLLLYRLKKGCFKVNKAPNINKPMHNRELTLIIHGFINTD